MKKIAVAITLLALCGLIWVGRARWRTATLDSLRAKTRAAVAAGRWAEAAAPAQRLTELSPDDGEAWLLRARVARQQGDLEASADALRHVGPDGPHARTARVALVELQFGPLNLPRQGAATCRELLRADPRMELPHQRLIFFYALSLQRESLVHQARQAIDLECEPLEAYVYLFFTDFLHFSNGVELNRRWLAADPTSELFTVARAVHLATDLEGGVPRDDVEVVRAIRRMASDRQQILGELLEKYPRNLELLAWHLEQGVERGDLDRVEQLLAGGPGEMDRDHRFWRVAGWAHLQRNARDQAEAAFQRALRLHPLDWGTRHLQAELRRLERRFDEVERLRRLVERAHELRRALESLPNVRSADGALLCRLADYAADCGDEQFAQGLRRRLTTKPQEDAGTSSGGER
ncbi:MAG: tetratricopeptide repeat protein [Planctomycetales bacterium]